MLDRIITETSARNGHELSVPGRTMAYMTDDQAGTDVVTVFDRTHAADICQESIERHLAGGQVRVDGERVTDPYHPAPRPAVIVLALE